MSGVGDHEEAGPRGKRKKNTRLQQDRETRVVRGRTRQGEGSGPKGGSEVKA